MWRSLFLAIGVYVFLLGAQCLGVDRFILKSRLPAAPQAAPANGGEAKVAPNRELVPREWAPWILMSTGIVVCGYSFTIPRRMKTK